VQWEVIAKYGKRKRSVVMDGGPTVASIRDEALHVIRNWYQHHSGTLGNEVWAKGTITVQSLEHEPVVIYDPSQETRLDPNDFSDDVESAQIIVLRPWRS
jgi:hypothetical protein